MSNITDWIKNELYPTLYRDIDIAFPEHNFKRYPGGWRSDTYLDGSSHKRKDKTIVSKKAPGRILEQGGDNLSLVDYVLRRDGGSFIEAVNTLAAAARLQVPKGDFDPAVYQRYKDKATLLEDCNNYFVYCLETSTGAKEIRDYLSGRGYSEEDIEVMELGYIPSQSKLIDYLKKRGHSETLINDVVKFHDKIGSTHKLMIPFRSGGDIKGFTARTIGDHSPKYILSTGLKRTESFFNIGSRAEEVIVVEGYLDALISEARGIKNVVALGSASISQEQVRDAIKRGAKSFTLCLDADKAGKEGTDKGIEVILGDGVSKVYIVTLPGKDPDEVIKGKGVEALNQAIREAIPYYEYQLQGIINKYGEMEADGALQPKEVDSFLEEVVATAAKIPEPMDRDRYREIFRSLDAIKSMGITEESLSIAVDRLTSTRDKEIQEREFRSLLSTAQKLQKDGKTNEALEALEDGIGAVKMRDKVSGFSKLLIPIKREELKERLANKPESLSSGYTIEGEELLLPSGAISILAAPTSHGKTTFLINLALNVAQGNQGKEVYLFSYEEDGDSILMKTLNTYQGERLCADNRRTIRTYFKTGSDNFIIPPFRNGFIDSEKQFFDELIDTGRLNIHYSNYNSDTLIESIRYLHKYANPGAIFIDYIQLLNLPEGKYKTYSRQEQMKQICQSLKDVAVDTGLPIILGAQFNRTVRNHLQLHATNIGEAGDIERIANLIVGFWNNEFKPEGTDGEINTITNDNFDKPNTIYATILKNRDGRVGLWDLLDYDGNVGKIKNKSKFF